MSQKPTGPSAGWTDARQRFASRNPDYEQLAREILKEAAAVDAAEEAKRAAVLELIDAVAASYPVNQDRLYLTGLSMGAIGIYGILPDHPTKFAAALAIAGFDPNEDPSAPRVFRCG